MNLLKFANTEGGKYLLGTLGQKPQNKITHITCNSFIEHLGGKEFQATFFSRRPIEKLFQPIFDKIQIANEYKRIENQHEALLHYSGLEPKNYKYPGIYLVESTFNPAAGAVSPVDGVASREGVDEAFTTIRAGAGTNASSISSEDYAFRVRTSATTDQFQILQRAFFLFNTSSLTETATISSAIFSLYFTTSDATVAVGGGNVVASTPAANNAIVNADYAQVGSTRFSTDKTMAGITGSAFNDFALNASGIVNINKTGISKFATRSVADIDNAAPAWAAGNLDGHYLCNLTDAGTNLPKLVVAYTSGGQSVFILQ